MRPDPNRRVIAATVNLAYDDQSMTTIDIHQGAAIGVQLDQAEDRDERDDLLGSGRRPLIAEHLRMVLRASTPAMGGGEFVTITRTPPGERSAAMTRIEINTEVEAYPVLSIRQDERGVSDVEIPAAMLDRLADAQDAVERAQLEIMRYVAEQYPDFGAVHEWLADRD